MTPPTYTIIPGARGFVVRRKGKAREDFHFSSAHALSNWLFIELVKQVATPDDHNIPSVLYARQA